MGFLDDLSLPLFCDFAIMLHLYEVELVLPQVLQLFLQEILLFHQLSKQVVLVVLLRDAREAASKLESESDSERVDRRVCAR